MFKVLKFLFNLHSRDDCSEGRIELYGSLEQALARFFFLTHSVALAFVFAVFVVAVLISAVLVAAVLVAAVLVAVVLVAVVLIAAVLIAAVLVVVSFE